MDKLEKFFTYILSKLTIFIEFRYFQNEMIFRDPSGKTGKGACKSFQIVKIKERFTLPFGRLSSKIKKKHLF